MFKNIGLTKVQAFHLLKVVGYVAASTAVGGAIALITGNPLAFGIATPAVNVFLVTVQQLLKAPEN